MRCFMLSLLSCVAMTFYSCDQELLSDQTTPLAETTITKVYNDKPNEGAAPPIEIEDLNIGYCDYFYKGDFTICPRRSPAGEKLEVWATRCGEDPVFIAYATKSDPSSSTHWEFSRKTSNPNFGFYQIAVVYGNSSGGLCNNGGCCIEDLECDNRWDAKIESCTVSPGPGGPGGTGQTGG